MIPRIFFTADTHYNHEKIIAHCNRPFTSVEEMNAYMEAAWNAVVGPTDFVFHLGDVDWKYTGRVFTERQSRLNGIKYLISGNHDTGRIRRHASWVRAFEYLEIPHPSDPNAPPIVLQHYPIRSWNRQRHGSIHLHGHVHGSYGWNTLPNSYDVGVDAIGFHPMNLEQIVNLYDTKRKELTDVTAK